MKTRKSTAQVLWHIAEKAVKAKVQREKIERALQQIRLDIEVVSKLGLIEITQARPIEELVSALEEEKNLLSLKRYRNENNTIRNWLSVSIDLDILKVSRNNMLILANILLGNYSPPARLLFAWHQNRPFNNICSTLTNMAIINESLKNEIHEILSAYRIVEKLKERAVNHIESKKRIWVSEEWSTSSDARFEASMKTYQHDHAMYLYYLEKGKDPMNTVMCTKKWIGGRSWLEDLENFDVPCACKNCIFVLDKTLLSGHQLDFDVYQSNVELEQRYWNDYGFDTKSYFKQFHKKVALKWSYDDEWKPENSINENIASIIEKYLPGYFGLFTYRHHKPLALGIVHHLRANPNLNAMEVYEFLLQVSNKTEIKNQSGEFNRRLHYCFRKLKKDYANLFVPLTYQTEFKK